MSDRQRHFEISEEAVSDDELGTFDAVQKQQLGMRMFCICCHRRAIEAVSF